MRERFTEGLFISALGLFGLLIGTRPIGDNSMLTHLRTGLTMARGGGIPRRDPYSFTALHHPWVVQSWLAEASYGWLQRIGGLHLVVLEQALLCGALALVIAWLARTGRPATTALAGLIAVTVGAAYWAPRPLLFGLLGLALTVAVTEGNRSPWWLVPITWVWVSTHGSFPLGLVWLVVSLAGDAIEGKGVVSRHRVQCLGAFVVGLVLSALNPLGPRLLLFPLKVQQKQSVFKAIIEWRSPNFQSGAGLVAFIGLVAALSVLAGRRVGWRHTLPAVTFIGLGLYAARNLPATAIVLAPALARALSRTPESPLDAQETRRGGSLDRAFAGLIGAVALAAVITVFARPPVDLSGYPVAAVTWMDQAGLRLPSHHVVEPDVAGNYLEYRYGADARVFVDDRYDMYPSQVSIAYQDLFFVRTDALDVLDRYRADVVLWQQGEPLVGLLQASGHWHEVHRAGGWVVLVRV